MGKIKSQSLRSRIRKYEEVSNIKLVSGLPVVIRLDGKAFHTFTKGFKKPFDDIVSRCMQRAMFEVCSEAQNCVMGYTQSDEITLVLCDYLNDDATCWFDNRLEKLVATTASDATLAFFRQLNREYINYDRELREREHKSREEYLKVRQDGSVDYFENLIDALDRKINFDSRAFNIPEHEIANVFIDRQVDAERNSIQMLAQSVIGKKQINGISNKKLQDKMFTEYGVNWNDIPTKFKRGSCCIKVPTEVKPGVIRERWTIDNEIPVFTANREYILSRFQRKDNKKEETA